MTSGGSLVLIVFLMVSSLVLLVAALVGGRTARVDARLRDLMGTGAPDPEEAPDAMAQLARSALPKMGTPLMPSDEEDRTRLQTRLIHAGLYSKQAMVLFLGVKMLLMIAPVLVGLAAGVLGLVPTSYGLLGGACLAIFGLIGPSFWLDQQKGERQKTFRRSLPDAMDLLVICLEGGLSLPAALQRVAGELRTAHPVLATELTIVQREVQLGRSSGEALRQMADRTDLEEIRGLASVILQADRFGASLVKSLRVHAETLRTKRRQRAEEMAQKAGTKILIPTLLFIFPTIYIVVLAPAMIQVMAAFGGMK